MLATLVIASALAAQEPSAQRVGGGALLRQASGEASAGQAPTQQKETVDSVLEKMARANAELTTIAADLVQQKSYPQLGISDPDEKGEFTVKRKPGGKLLARIEIREPETRIVTLKDHKYLLYQPRIKQAIEGSVDPKSAGRAGTGFLTYFLGGVSSAGKDYDIQLAGKETIGGREAAHLKLTAKTGASAPYRQVDLWVDEEWWIPIQQQFIEPNQNQILMRFEKMRLNKDVPDEHFTVKLPPGVEKVRG